MCSPLYNRYRCGSFWHKNLCLKSQVICPMEKITTIKIPFKKDMCSWGRHQSVSVLKFCLAALLRILYHLGEWGIFLLKALTLPPGSDPIVHCSLLLLILSVDDFSIIILGHIWNGCWRDVPSSFLPRDIGVLRVNGYDLFYLVQCSKYFETATLLELNEKGKKPKLVIFISFTS